MGQRCSNETGNVKGNGAGSKRPLVLPECVSDSFDQLETLAKGLLLNTGGWHNRRGSLSESPSKIRNAPSYHQSPLGEVL